MLDWTRLKIVLAACAILSVSTLTGCNNGDKGDGIQPSQTKALGDVNAAAVAADGDFDKLSSEGKKQALSMAGGNEQAARNMVKMMAHPPNEGNKYRSGKPSTHP